MKSTPNRPSVCLDTQMVTLNVDILHMVRFFNNNHFMSTGERFCLFHALSGIVPSKLYKYPSDSIVRNAKAATLGGHNDCGNAFWTL